MIYVGTRLKLQAVFRAFQARKQYFKIVWSVGVVEKAILRWRKKRQGFRGLQVQIDDTPKDPNQESDGEEDFFQASRKQAEERVERSVIRVQAMFRSKQAQEDYRRMKLEHSKATVMNSFIYLHESRVIKLISLFVFVILTVSVNTMNYFPFFGSWNMKNFFIPISTWDKERTMYCPVASAQA